MPFTPYHTAHGPSSLSGGYIGHHGKPGIPSSGCVATMVSLAALSSFCLRSGETN